MIVYRTKQDLARHLDALLNKGKSIGLVPTMGALHQGHTSLVEKAAGQNDIVVVTIFVNPSQFNDPADLEKYPRTLDQDLELLQSLNVDLVFVPSVMEMYPEEDTRTFDLGNLDKVMEGKHRKGHFNGVAQIVSKFFETVHPTRAYFGLKDFQQLVIIRRLVEILNMNLDIVECPIIREEDGLAMSSRNVRLNRNERKLASFIYITLQLAREKRGLLSPAEVKSWVISQFRDQPLMQLEYFEIVEDKELKPIVSWEDQVNKVGCIAVHLGGVRLIDNLYFD
ncbi:MAG: pantoate--beta-alanine ligase [Bacteroidota bacterium]